MRRRTLVLGAGGLTGTAWEIGLLRGFADRGLDLTRADVILGTSSGAVTAALLATGRTLVELFEEQLVIPDHAKREPYTAGSLIRTSFTGWMTRGEDQAKRAAIAQSAVRRFERGGKPKPSPNLPPVPDEWPDRDIRVTAVDAETGALRVFSRADGVPFGRAVAASAALPFVRPPVEIEGRYYVDGSIRSKTNADLATGAANVVVLAPEHRSRGRGHGISPQLRSLGEQVRAAAVAPDRRTLVATGEKIFDPRRVPRAARAGFNQSLSMLEGVTKAWRA